MRFELRQVDFMPKVLEPSIIYVSEKYGTAAHLCACGCGEKIRTPLGPAEWAVTVGLNGPSVWPSVGSWQRPCRSHYVIRDGEVRWARQWSDAEVSAGQSHERAYREAHFAKRTQAHWISKIWNWVKSRAGRR